MKKLNNVIEGFFQNSGGGFEAAKENVYKRLKEIVQYPYIREDFIVNKDLTVDYIGGREVGISQLITELGVQFNKCNGTFDLMHCTDLKTLKGSPRIVMGMFRCSWCDSLKTLEGAPEKVYGIFACEGCKSLESLKGSPSEVGKFNCSYCNKLKTLEGSSDVVRGGFNCHGCENLVSLKGISKHLRHELWLLRCSKLKSLKYIPQNLKGVDIRYCHPDIDTQDIGKYTNLIQ